VDFSDQRFANEAIVHRIGRLSAISLRRFVASDDSRLAVRRIDYDPRKKAARQSWRAAPLSKFAERRSLPSSFPAWLLGNRLSDRSSEPWRNQAYQEKHQENNEQDVGDVRRRSSQPAETQCCRDKRDHQERECPT
jgi:hypothetical protein